MATKARLHWFWRGAIAGMVGAIACIGLEHASVAAVSNCWCTALGCLVTSLAVLPIPYLATYGLLTRYFGPPAPDGESHCRRCHHILRGLSEPRCPECGEPI